MFHEGFDVVTFLGTSFQLSLGNNMQADVPDINVWAKSARGQVFIAYGQSASHTPVSASTIQANRGYDPTVQSIHCALFQCRYNNGYTNYLCTATLLVRKSPIPEVHSIPAHETHLGEPQLGTEEENATGTCCHSRSK